MRRLSSHKRDMASGRHVAGAPLTHSSDMDLTMVDATRSLVTPENRLSANSIRVI